MEQDERPIFVETLDAIASRERETKRALNRDAETFDERQISLDGVGIAIDGGDMLIKEAGSFPGVAHPIKFSRMTDPSDERASEQALKIERHIGSQPSRFAQPWEQMPRHAKAGQVAARENVDVIDRPVAAE